MFCFGVNRLRPEFIELNFLAVYTGHFADNLQMGAQKKKYEKRK